MCKRKPGPRCYNHARPRLEKAQANVEGVEEQYKEALSAAGGDKSQVPPAMEEARKQAYADRYEAMRQYYSTPRARKELQDTVIPNAEKAQADAEAAYNADPSEENKKARTVARAEYTKNRNLLRHGETRWSQANADLDTNERCRNAMNDGDFEAAKYNNVDLSRAGSWDTLKSKPKWSSDRKSVRREVRMETPMQERVNAVADTNIVKTGQGYRVDTTVHAQYGFTATPDSSQSALPAWQDNDTKKVKADSEFRYTKVRQHKMQSQEFGSYAEAKSHASKIASPEPNQYDSVAAGLANQARARTVMSAAKRRGITTQSQYDEHMRKVRANEPEPAEQSASKATTNA